jgi:hypothetical protein
MGMVSLIPKTSSLGRWGMIVENLSSRNLTHEEDISRVLAGATEVLSSTSPVVFVRVFHYFFDITFVMAA